MRLATVANLIEEGVRRLDAAGVERARFESRLLLAKASGLGVEALIGRPEQPVEEAAAERFRAWLARRAAREPMARILGSQEFWSLPFALGPDTLIPRPDSETLVEAALAGIADRQAAFTLLDLGTGSGCLLLALLSELPQAYGIGVDRSPAAAAQAAANALHLGLAERARFVVGDWGAPLAGHFDLILANPPYLRTGDIPGLDPEVAGHEPLLALDGGPDGLDAVRALASDLSRLLKPGGRVLVEVGLGQAPAAEAIFRACGLAPERRYRDLGGVDRVVAAIYPAPAKKNLECAGIESRLDKPEAGG